MSSTLGYMISAMGVVQYIGECHDLCDEYHECIGSVQCIGGIIGTMEDTTIVVEHLQCTDDIPPHQLRYPSPPLMH